MPDDTNLVELCTTCSEHEANLILGLLHANNIRAQLKSYRISQFPFDIGHIGEIKIMVIESDLEEAQKIIRAPFEGENSE